MNVRGLLLATLVSVSVPVFAVGPDVTALVSAVDFDTVITGILAVFAVMIGVVVTMKAGGYVIRAVRGG